MGSSDSRQDQLCLATRILQRYCGPSQVETVTRYILNQEEHHRRKSFQDEYIEMLKLAGIEYDERYVW